MWAAEAPSSVSSRCSLIFPMLSFQSAGYQYWVCVCTGVAGAQWPKTLSETLRSGPALRCGIVRSAVYACAQYMYVAPIMFSAVSVLSSQSVG